MRVSVFFKTAKLKKWMWESLNGVQSISATGETVREGCAPGSLSILSFLGTWFLDT